MQEARKLLLILSIVSLTQLSIANNGKEGNKAEPSLQGSVSDAGTRKPVKGVTIYIQTPTNKHAVITDASGNFKLPKVSGGSKVTIVLEKKGYKTYRREGVVLKEGMIFNINMDALIEEPEAEVFHPLHRMMDGFR